jgi:Flp pilus assembly protein TadG
MRRLSKIRKARKDDGALFTCAQRHKAGAFSCLDRLKSALPRLRETSGAELLEFALALPLLLVLVIGIIDFARAYNTKHVMSNAAREAARIVTSTPLSDSSCPSGWQGSSPGSGTPCAIQTAANSVGNYLTAAGLTSGACLLSAPAAYTPSATAIFMWTYTCGNVTLVINKSYLVPNGAGGYSISATKVTLSYPYTFMFGSIIGLLVKGATGLSGLQILTTDAVMQNLTSVS